MHVPHIHMYAAAMHACQAAFSIPETNSDARKRTRASRDRVRFRLLEAAYGLRK
jgi:hypothetical protein